MRDTIHTMIALVLTACLLCVAVGCATTESALDPTTNATSSDVAEDLKDGAGRALDVLFWLGTGL